MDIGVRVEVRNEIMEEVNNVLYESKLIGYPKPFKNKVRTLVISPATASGKVGRTLLLSSSFCQVLFPSKISPYLCARTPGFASPETLLYSPELKFYSNKIKMDENLNTNIKNLYCLGDSSGWTRGLMMAFLPSSFSIQNISISLHKNFAIAKHICKFSNLLSISNRLIERLCEFCAAQN